MLKYDAGDCCCVLGSSFVVHALHVDLSFHYLYEAVI